MGATCGKLGLCLNAPAEFHGEPDGLKRKKHRWFHEFHCSGKPYRQGLRDGLKTSNNFNLSDGTEGGCFGGPCKWQPLSRSSTCIYDAAEACSYGSFNEA